MKRKNIVGSFLYHSSRVLVYKLYERSVNALYTWKIVQQQRFESGQDVVRPNLISHVEYSFVTQIANVIWKYFIFIRTVQWWKLIGFFRERNFMFGLKDVNFVISLVAYMKNQQFIYCLLDNHINFLYKTYGKEYICVTQKISIHKHLVTAVVQNTKWRLFSNVITFWRCSSDTYIVNNIWWKHILRPFSIN